ncbi:MAG: hypothetical protein WC881_06725 [Elusimicrobiota bacterium]|jgi:hypothetical protein
MRTISLAVCAFLALASGACHKAAPLSAGLKDAVRKVRFQAPCNTVIPQEWPASLPVPTGAAGGAEFKIFFYPLGQAGTPNLVNAPLGAAVFDSQGTVASCARLPGEKKGLSNRRWPQAVDKLDVDELQQELDRLYAATAEVAVLYAAQAAITDAARKTLQDYSSRFSSLAEPALLPDYYKLNPDFWVWLERCGAPAPIKR